jgi:DNA-binding MarR family transcriptional regulator
MARNHTVIDMIEEFDSLARLYEKYEGQLHGLASSKSIELISVEQISILRWAQKAPITNSELMKRTGWGPAHVSQRTSPLVSQSLLCEVTVGGDRRKRSFSTSAAGQKVLESLSKLMQEAFLSVCPGATKERSGLLLGALRQINRSTTCPADPIKPDSVPDPQGSLFPDANQLPDSPAH